MNTVSNEVFTDQVSTLISGGLDADSAVMVVCELHGFPAEDVIWDHTGQLWIIQQPVPSNWDYIRFTGMHTNVDFIYI